MSSHTFLRTITKDDPFKVCFVCLGNICRSPTAEGIFLHLIKEKDLQEYFHVDSAGTSTYHIGEQANSKSQSTANKYGIHLPSLARKLDYNDLEEFDLVLAMDSDNLYSIKELDTINKFSGKVHLIREFDPNAEGKDVPDPYYGGMTGFEDVYTILYRCCQNLFSILVKQIEK